MSGPKSAQSPYGRRYLLGLGLGLIPVPMWWLTGAVTRSIGTYGAATLCPDSTSSSLQPLILNGRLLLYFINIIVMISCHLTTSLHSNAYGLATMVGIAPVVAVVGSSWISGAVQSG